MGPITNLYPLAAVFLAGFSLAVVVVLSLRAIYARAARDRVEDITEHIKAAFGDLSLEALSRSTEEFLKLAKSRFDAEGTSSSRTGGKKELIDRRLKRDDGEAGEPSRGWCATWRRTGSPSSVN